MSPPFEDRDQWLPILPPGWKRRQQCVPGRCWTLTWRDRLAWRIFCRIANSDHSQVVWQTFRSTRRSNVTTWNFGSEGTESSSTIAKEGF